MGKGRGDIMKPDNGVKREEGKGTGIRRARFRMFGILLSILLTGCRVVGGAEEITLLPGTAAPDPTVTTAQVLPQPVTGAPVSRASLILCEIKGQVRQPGVYELAEGSRAADLIQRSGGVLADGSLEWVNQAKKLADGEVVVIPVKGTSRSEYEAMSLAVPFSPGQATEQPGSPALVNINTASAAQLESVPGIGPVMAGNILAHRTAKGPFSVLEELKEVDRIGDKTFVKLTPDLTVGP